MIIILYLIEAKQTDNSSHIYEFYRNDDGTSETKVIVDFKHYFFVDEEAPVENLNGVVTTQKGFKSIEKTPVKKVIMQQSFLTRDTRLKIEDMGYDTWEADVPFHNRYTIDLPEDIKEGKLKVCFFDIETAPEETFEEGIDLDNFPFPDVELADQVICSICAQINEKMVRWLCGPKEVKNCRYFEKEEDMLNNFLDYIYNESPDIISAWYLDGFDLPFILNRCKRLGLDFKKLSKVREVFIKKLRNKNLIKTIGTVQIDLLEAYKLWRQYGNMPKLAGYSLDFVARTVLGDKKLEHGKSIAWLWKNDPETLLEYNEHDVELLAQIDARCKVIDFFDSLRRKCHVQFDDVYRTTALIDGFLLNKLNKTMILPTAKKNKTNKFDGAYVFPPKPGIYDNVLCEDIKSMYPSIIKNFNISYETVGGIDITLPLSPSISFSNEPGLIPRFMDDLAAERNGYKKKMYAAKTKAENELWYQRQYATKIVMNSFFGYLGYPGSRLYKREVANAVTGMGKYIILKIADWVEEKGNTVIYGDTDSVYVTANSTEKYDVVSEGVSIGELIDEKLDIMCTELAGYCCIYMEFEKALSRILFTDAKKRYAYTLLWDGDEGKKFNVDSDIHITGFDSKRSDSSSVAKKMQLKVVEMLIKGATREEIVGLIKDKHISMKAGNLPDNEIGFPKGISKDLCEYLPPSPIIKGAAFSNQEFNTNYGKGSKPMFVYIKGYNGTQPKITIGKKEYMLESIAYDSEIPEGMEVNWDKMSVRTFKMKLEKLFNAVGWEWPNLDNKGLGMFM